MSYLIDTDVIAELRKGDRCDPAVASWFASVTEDSIYLSVLVLGDIGRGIESIRLRDVSSAQALDRWLRRVVRDHTERLIGVDEEIVEEWGRLSVPDPLPVIDGLLVATALVRGLTLVTRNTENIESTGVSYLNPFLSRNLDELREC